MSERNAYLQKLNARMKEWEAQIDQLEAQASQVAANLRLQYEKQIDCLKVQQSEAREQLQHFESLGDDRWKEFKAEMEKSWVKFENSVRDVVSRF